MFPRRQILFVVSVLFVCLAFTQARAQAGTISGVVVDAETRQPLAFVNVSLSDSTGVIQGVVTGSQGRFGFADVTDQAHSLFFYRNGYQPRTERDVYPGDGVLLVQLVVGRYYVMDPVVISVSRERETGLQAPASTSVIEREAVEEATLLTPVDQTRTVTGVDFASKGMIQHTYAVRGHRSANSGALLVMTDYRYTAVPALDINVPYLLAVSKEDVDRIEVARGPSAALYGPNSDRGILHIITRSPLESRGTSLSLGLGERNVLQGWLRHAGTAGAKLGYKVSAEYFRGDDWEYVDPNELEERDNKAERAVGEARVDWRPAVGSEWSLTGGIAKAINVVDLTTLLGAVQVKNWLYPYLQLQTKQGRFFGNVVYNGSDSGDTFALRTGSPLVDESRLASIQLQYGSDLGRTTRLLYGVDARHTDPRTKGTILGRNEDDDGVSEIGAYLSANTTMKEHLSLVGALRVDYNDRVNDAVLSPRFGVVYRVKESQSWRVTYNRAFSSPDAAALFLDTSQGPLDPALPYEVRATAVPKDGFTFSRNCEGIYCMQNRWHEVYNDINLPTLPADATRTWAVLLKELPELSGIGAPSSSQVGTDLRSFDGDSAFVPIQESDVVNVPGPRRVLRNTLEAGYKGILGDSTSWVSLQADAYWTHVKDNRGPPWIATPNVFFNRETLEAYLIGEGMDPDSAAAAAAAASEIPMGTISPDQVGTQSDLLAVTQQVSDYTYTFWGIDLGLELSLSRRFILGADYSYFHENVIAGVAVVDTVVLSVPNHKGAVWLRLRGKDGGWTAGIKGRAVDGFRVDSGVYKGIVDAYTALDVDIGYRLTRVPRVLLSLNATNVFDNRHQEYVGAPDIGRLVIVRLQLDL